MSMPEFRSISIGFLHLAQDLGLEVLVPSHRPVLYLLEEARPLLPLEGALLLARPEGNLWRYRTASGFLLPAPDPELLEYARKEGLGVAVYPPWLKREELAKAVALRLFHLGSGLGMAGLLDLLLRLPERPFLEVLYQATGLALARVAPWGEVLGFAGPVPPQHPKEPGEGRGWLSLEAGEGVLVAYGEEEGLRQARGLLEVAARLLRVRALERSLERMREESLGGALLEGLILGEAEPDRLFAFGFTEGGGVGPGPGGTPGGTGPPPAGRGAKEGGHPGTEASGRHLSGPAGRALPPHHPGEPPGGHVAGAQP